MTNTIPDWATAYIQEWQAKLLLHEWSIRTRIAAAEVEDGKRVQATCYVYPEIRRADIEFSRHISAEPTAVWQHAVVHELLHVRLGLLTDYIDNVLLPQLSPSASAVADAGYRREMEAAVDLLTSILLMDQEELDNAETAAQGVSE